MYFPAVVLNLLQIFSDPCNGSAALHNAALEETLIESFSADKSPPNITLMEFDSCNIPNNVIHDLLNKTCHIQETLLPPEEELYSYKYLQSPDCAVYLEVSSSSIYQPTPKISSTCQEYIDFMKDCLDIILEASKMLVEYIEDSRPTEEWCAYIADLQETITANNRTIDQLLLNHTKTIKTLETNWRKSNQSFEIEIREVEEILDEMAAEADVYIYDLVVNSIRAGNHKTARDNFVKMKNESILSDIGRDTFKVPFILSMKFSSLLSVNQRIIYYTSLFQEMINDGSIISGNILLFGEAVNAVLRSCQKDIFDQCGSYDINDFRQIVERVNNAIEDYKAACVTSIKDGDFGALIKFASPNLDDEKEWQALRFAEIIPDIISRLRVQALSEVEFAYLIKFLNALPRNLHKFVAYKALAEENWSSGEWEKHLHIALHMKVAEDNQDGPDLCQNYDSVKSLFPRLIRELVWHTRCYLRNTYYNNEYLYAANDQMKFTFLDRRVFTWKPRDNVSQSPWQFLPIIRDNETEILFRIRNVHWNAEYLACHAESKNFNSERGYVSTSWDGCWRVVHYWKLTIASLSERTINLWHVGRGAYLYASSSEYNDDRRYPFLWLNGDLTRESYWLTECN